jgi:hypothetical protein
MTEEIAELARQAGIRFRQDVFYSGYCDGVHGDELEAFAKLVADKEREACTKRASVALLGTLKTTSDRVLAAIQARGERDL